MLGEEQNGFMQGRNCLEIVVVMKIIERNKTLGKKLYLVFLYIEKGYDRVDRRKLLTLLADRGKCR